MRKLMTLASLALFAVAFQANAADWRELALKNGQNLAEKIEVMDEFLHELKADAVVQKVHHLEGTVLDFNDGLSEGITYEAAREEFNHITQDLNEIYSALRQANLFSNANVVNSWNQTVFTYRNLARLFTGCDG